MLEILREDQVVGNLMCTGLGCMCVMRHAVMMEVREPDTSGVEGQQGTTIIVQVRGCEALSQDQSSVIRRVLKK